jgi:hypothetical protein
MSLEENVFLLLSGAIVLVLVLVNAFLLWYFYKTNKKIDTLLEKGKIKDFKDIFLSQKERNNNLEDRINEAFLKIKDLEELSQRTIQKTSVVRFNPFNDLGGNQSFVIALLDNNNDGLVISSLFVKDGSRVYTKAVKSGKSDNILSKEENEAISRAIGLK